MAPAPPYAFDAFLDESHDGTSVYTVAGFLAPREAWMRLWPAWQTALANEGVITFHAVDCEKRANAFKGWSVDRSERLQRALIALLKNPAFGLVSYAASLDLTAHASLEPRLRKVFRFPPGLSVSGPLHGPYFMLMQRVVEHIATEDFLTGYPPKDLIGFTFDRQEKAHNAKAVAEAMWRFRPWGSKIRGAGWMDSSKIIPLQIADLLAYETFRHHRDTSLGVGTERWQHFEMSSLSRIDEFHDAAQLEAILILNERKLAAQVAASRPAATKKRRPRS